MPIARWRLSNDAPPTAPPAWASVRRSYLVNMNWAALVPILRAMLDTDGRCLDCGHRFVNERDVQIEHIEPPRTAGDWAREHARNLRLACQSCNGTKGQKPFAAWLAGC
jgi:5-methylcytosine-specific restriction endonuclease McrA